MKEVVIKLNGNLTVIEIEAIQQNLQRVADEIVFSLQDFYDQAMDDDSSSNPPVSIL